MLHRRRRYIAGEDAEWLWELQSTFFLKPEGDEVFRRDSSQGGRKLLGGGRPTS
jgi:hypothetical protein